ncbi:MAG: fumarylacetoacetate hydrolase family protein [Rhodothermales bacterium]|jgi:2-keto-4-pentenoate hydratase/2-oxohepta-3-ene-1,7-dioic acid hydratase in catechol pathway
MEEYRIPVPATGGKATYRAGKLVCIGRNYAKHAAELGNAVPTSPMIFLKPASALIPSGSDIVIPPASADVHHEVELVCLIGTAGSHIPRERALDHVAGYAVGLDMTARDIQLLAKEKGHPWSVAKGYDTFAPLGNFVPAEAVSNPQDLSIRLEINGEERQAGHTGDMIFPVDTLIAYASTIFTLMPGDLLFTGTPEGVGPVREGDRLCATVEGLPPLEVGVRTS